MRPRPAGSFCWVDLAATDAPRAIDFYAGLFGWAAHPQRANGGTFVRLSHEGRDVGSLYQLGTAARDAGATSHWTPYVAAHDVETVSRRATELGGSVLVDPFAVDGVARIALLGDPVGAAFGVWEKARK